MGLVCYESVIWLHADFLGVLIFVFYLTQCLIVLYVL